MKKFLTATAIATILALNLCAATSASAGKVLYIRYNSDGDGNTVTVHDGRGYLGGHFYNEDWEYEGSWYPDDIDPNPEDGDSGLGNADRDAIIEALKRLGGAPYEFTPEFWLTPIGRDLADNGIGGFNVTDPPPEYDLGALGYDDGEGHGGSGGGFDPMGGSLQDNIRQNAGKGSSGDDDDDDSDPPPTHQGESFPGPPELVNPVPILRLTARTVDLQPNMAVIGR